MEPRGELWARRKSRGLPDQPDRCTRSPGAQSPRVQPQPPHARCGSRAAVWAAGQNRLSGPGSGTSPDRGSSSAPRSRPYGSARQASQAQPALRSPWSPATLVCELPRSFSMRPRCCSQGGISPHQAVGAPPGTQRTVLARSPRCPLAKRRLLLCRESALLVPQRRVLFPTCAVSPKRDRLRLPCWEWRK